MLVSDREKILARDPFMMERIVASSLDVNREVCGERILKEKNWPAS